VQPAAGIDAVRQATRRVLRSIDQLTDEDVHAPSRLSGWNRAEVITHLARNADGTRGMAEAAARGEAAAMYPGGPEQRATDIAAGHDERASVLRLDLRRASDALVETWDALPADAWDRVGMTSLPRTMRDMLWVRLREVEVHHVDLALGYEPSDWPVSFVTAALRETFASFGQRASSKRPMVDADFRVVSTDHECAWHVEMRGAEVHVRNDGDGVVVDGEARGWGCDVVAWLYGRDPRGGALTVTGDAAVLRLPQWFPYG
jgi:maleylpyruvate isomerase